MGITLRQRPLIWIARGVWCALSLTAIGMGEFSGRKESGPDVPPELWGIAFSSSLKEKMLLKNIAK
jgi:hypothetical protein